MPRLGIRFCVAKERVHGEACQQPGTQGRGCPSPSLPQPWSSAWARDLSPCSIVGPCGRKGGL